MISTETFTPQWIDSFRRQEQYRRVNPALFEKMVYAFALLESLAKTDFDFIFKGGTSIILMPVSTNRLAYPDLKVTSWLVLSTLKMQSGILQKWLALPNPY